MCQWKLSFEFKIEVKAGFEPGVFLWIALLGSWGWRRRVGGRTLAHKRSKGVRPTAVTKIKKRRNLRLLYPEAEVEELRSMFAAALRLQCDQIFRQKVAQCVAQINS